MEVHDRNLEGRLTETPVGCDTGKKRGKESPFVSENVRGRGFRK